VQNFSQQIHIAQIFKKFHASLDSKDYNHIKKPSVDNILCSLIQTTPSQLISSDTVVKWLAHLFYIQDIIQISA
jgi:hypothetical protein